jgi:hypothetical protein
VRTKFWSENLKGRDNWKDPATVDGGDNIRMDLREVGWEGVDWIHLPQDRDQWQAFVNTVNEAISSIKGGEFID